MRRLNLRLTEGATERINQNIIDMLEEEGFTLDWGGDSEAFLWKDRFAVMIEGDQVFVMSGSDYDKEVWHGNNNEFYDGYEGLDSAGTKMFINGETIRSR